MLKPVIVIIFAIAVFYCPSSVSAQNTYQIVLVHGFAGWGRGELFNIKYWGIFTDLEANLNQSGYPTVSAKVGPFSSNWHRACELYAQLLGLPVDYGQYHAQTYKYLRTSRDYTGHALYPSWSSTNKVHFISHSMGGQTVRVLAYVLNQGDANEKLLSGHSLLFDGGKDWVASITTLSSPHDGTTLANIIGNVGDFVISLVGIAGIGLQNSLENFYDLYLDTYGLIRQPGETFGSFVTRALGSSLFQIPYNHAISLWDLSTDGAKELNGLYPTQSNIYHFSYSTSATHPYCNEFACIASIFGICTVRNFFNCIDYNYGNNWDMNPLFLIFGAGMGSYVAQPGGPSNYASNGTALNYRQNDGVVNSLGTRYPTNNLSPSIVSGYTDFSTSYSKGTWNHLAFKSTWDHFDIIGGDPFINVTPFYLNIAAFLYGIPTTASYVVTSSVAAGFDDTNDTSNSVNCTNLRILYISDCAYGKDNSSDQQATYCSASANYLKSIGCDYSLPTVSAASTLSDITKMWLVAIVALIFFFNKF